MPGPRRALWLSCILLFGLWAGLGPAPAARAQTPDARLSPGAVHVPELSGICAMGTEADTGCAAIRAREILDAAAAPWRAIGRVNFASLQQRSHCTGTLVAEDVVLTAAHCLYNAARKAWIPPESLRFVAGYQRGAGVAVAGVRRYVLDPGQDPASRAFRGGIPGDWALLVLEAPLGRQVGVLPLAAAPSRGQIALAGYAGLRPHVLSLATGCGPAHEAGPDGAVLVTGCAAMQGDSGAPLLVLSDTGPVVLGVLSAVASTDGGPRALGIPAERVVEALAAIAGP
jgi:protease YdgD